MRSAGFTLVELLVVITIISLMAMIGMTSFKDFSEKQITIKAQGQVQTLLRLAQSNATTSTKCNNINPSTSWSVILSQKSIILHCEPGNVERTYELQNAEIEKIECNIPAGLPATFSYSTGTGVLTFLSTDCVNATSWDITIRNLKNTNLEKKLTISKGGTINVE